MIVTEKRVHELRADRVGIAWSSALPIFASEPFLKSVGDDYGWLGGRDQNGGLRCVLPYTIIRKAGFKMVRFRVETIAWERELAVVEEKSFLNSAIEYFRSLGADMVIPANNTALFRVYPDGAVVAPYGTYIKGLVRSEDILWGELHADYRQNIRKAGKSGVRVKSGIEHLRNSYTLIADTLRRSGQSFRSEAQFYKMVSGLGDNVRIFVAEHQDVLQACMVCPFSQHGAYDWYSGTISKPVRGAMHMLVWEAMRQFREMGVKQFNFTGVRINPEAGSKQDGIRNFKMRFGGGLVQGYMWKYSFHSIKFAVYSAAEYLLMRGKTVRFGPAPQN